MFAEIRRLLAHPETQDLTIDDPRTTSRRTEIIQANRFLWRIYDEWYSAIAAGIPQGAGRVLELGSGGGFFDRYVPDAIRSEVFACPGTQVLFDARSMPFSAGSLKSITMVDVLHHIPDNRAFLNEARRCLRPGGKILMIEPWVSAWSRLIYTHLHHEPFQPEAKDWTFPNTGPLSGANGALPWIIFERDRKAFESEFPELVIEIVKPFMPFRYLVSGGVSMRQLMPEAVYGLWRKVESLFGARRWSMFAFIQITRQ